MENLKKNLILIHGAGPKHYRSLADGTGDWQAKLPTLLGDGYKILRPEMPSLTKPSYAEWKILMDKYVAKVRGELTFVGHSLGGAFLVKYLTEEKISQKISGLYIVSAPFNTVKGFEAPTDISALKKIENIFLYHSIDDVEVPYAHALIYQSRLQAELRTFTDRGHYFKRAEFTEIAQDIKMATARSDQRPLPDISNPR